MKSCGNSSIFPYTPLLIVQFGAVQRLPAAALMLAPASDLSMPGAIVASFGIDNWRTRLIHIKIPGRSLFMMAEGVADLRFVLDSTRCTELHERPGQAKRRGIMLYYAAVFFVIAIVAAVLGFGGIAAGAAEIARILFFIFLVIFVVTLLLGILRK